jgi:hypothetical protein
MPGGPKGAVGTILPSLLASLLAICWRGGTRAENSEWEAFLVLSVLCIVPQQPPRLALLVPQPQGQSRMLDWIASLIGKTTDMRTSCQFARELLALAVSAV